MIHNLLLRILKQFKRGSYTQIQPVKKVSELRSTPADSRDYPLGEEYQAIAEKSDLRKWVGKPKNQKFIGSCMAHTTATIMETLWKKNKGYELTGGLSELFHYWVGRNISAWADKDRGMDMRTACKAAQQTGICPELYWPYDPTKWAQKPSLVAYVFAKWFKISSYRRLKDVSEIKKVLTAGYPVALGIFITNRFFVVRGNQVLPYDAKEKNKGGHAIIVVGHDDTKKALLIQNSWGNSWGFGGYGWISYEYVENHWLDAWMMEMK